jgi:hypothetical protein
MYVLLALKGFRVGNWGEKTGATAALNAKTFAVFAPKILFFNLHPSFALNLQILLQTFGKPTQI